MLIPVLALLSCGKHPAETQAPVPAPAPPAPPPNVFASASTLPYELPPFDKITDADFRPAFDEAIAAHTKEVRAIADNPESPTFENTLVALQECGAELQRVSKVFYNLVGSNTDDDLEKIEQEEAPKLAAHADAVLLDTPLFLRISAIYNQRETLHLDAESMQLLERTYHDFVQAGAKLGDEDKAKLKAINERLSTLGTQFDQNVLQATKDGAVVVDDVARLKGLSDEQIGAAAQAAKDRGLDGKWVLTLQNTTIQPVLTTLDDRALRETIYRASIGRANGGPSDNTAIVAEAMKLRAQKAALLGYPNYASYALVDETAGTPDAVDKILGDIGASGLSKAKQEAADIQRAIDTDCKAKKVARFDLQPWDWAYYAEKVRQAKYAFDESQVKPYFELDHVLKDGVFYAATQLYGITFEERHDLPVYAGGVRVFEVSDADGSKLGLLLLDYYARDNKQGGAWMDTYVDQSTLLGHHPVVVNNVNVNQPAEGQPTLLTFDEVTTMFHEFGHGLHGLLSNVKYPALSGTNTPPDFAEFPSQFNEMWASEPAVLTNYAKHYQTGAPMPKDLFDKVQSALKFNQGFDTLEYVEAATVDMAWHQVGVDAIPDKDGVLAFEDASLKKAGMSYAPIPPRYHTPYFSHVFNGGYAAGYYAYIWSEVLARDAGAWFHKNGGMTRKNGDTFRADILSRGRTAEPSALFQTFYGGPPETQPLLEWRGLTSATAKKAK